MKSIGHTAINTSRFAPNGNALARYATFGVHRQELFSVTMMFSWNGSVDGVSGATIGAHGTISVAGYSPVAVFMADYRESSGLGARRGM